MAKTFVKTASAIVLLSACISCVPKQKSETFLQQGVSTVLALRTYEQIYHAIGYINYQQSVLIFKTVDRELLYAIDIRIHAGIDGRDGIRIVRKPGRRFLVTLPPAKILMADADESSIRQYFARGQEQVRLLEYGDQIAKLKARAVNDSLKRGILVSAERQARTIVRAYLLQTGARHVDFTGSGGTDG